MAQAFAANWPNGEMTMFSQVPFITSFSPNEIGAVSVWGPLSDHQRSYAIKSMYDRLIDSGKFRMEG